MTEHEPLRDFRWCPICELAVQQVIERLGIPVDDLEELINRIERAAW
jgi:hypothetical protein